LPGDAEKNLPSDCEYNTEVINDSLIHFYWTHVKKGIPELFVQTLHLASATLRPALKICSFRYFNDKILQNNGMFVAPDRSGNVVAGLELIAENSTDVKLLYKFVNSRNIITYEGETLLPVRVLSNERDFIFGNSRMASKRMYPAPFRNSNVCSYMCNAGALYVIGDNTAERYADQYITICKIDQSGKMLNTELKPEGKNVLDLHFEQHGSNLDIVGLYSNIFFESDSVAGVFETKFDSNLTRPSINYYPFTTEFQKKLAGLESFEEEQFVESMPWGKYLKKEAKKVHGNRNFQIEFFNRRENYSTLICSKMVNYYCVFGDYGGTKTYVSDWYCIKSGIMQVTLGNGKVTQSSCIPRYYAKKNIFDFRDVNCIPVTDGHLAVYHVGESDSQDLECLTQKNLTDGLQGKKITGEVKMKPEVTRSFDNRVYFCSSDHHLKFGVLQIE
jgi:hypothetical protein